MTANVYGATDRVAKAGDTMTGTLVLTGATPMQIPAGAANGDVLTSDGSGNAAWQMPGAVAGVDYINVKAPAYGAKGDSTTDDTTAIQNAINAAGIGQVVYFPRGTYLVSSTLTLASSVLYLGSDTDKTVIKMKAGANLAAVAASTGWVGSTATSSVDPLHIRNLTFDGNKANQTSGAGHGVVLQTYYATVENCIILNTRGDGLRFDANGANGSTAISNTMVENWVSRVQCRSNGGNGVNVNDPSHNKATDGWLQHIIVDTPGQNGILCQSSAGWTVDGCHVYNIPFSGIRMDRAFETRIVNNYVESCGTSTTSGTYCLIDCANGQANDGGQGSVISGNTAYFQGPPGNVGSTIAGISVQSASGGSANFAIVGNQLFCTGSSGLPAIQLQNQNGTASLTAKVSGNNLVGWTTGVSQVANGGTMTASGDNITPLPVNLGGTGSTSQNFVDLTTAQTVGGTKTFSSAPIALGVFTQPSAAANTAVSTNVSGTDAFDRFRILGSGAITIGPGTATRDAQIARTAVGTLQLTNPNTVHAATWNVDGIVSALTEALSTGASGGKVLTVANTTSAPTADNVLLTSQAAGDATLGIQVNGDTKDRWTIDSTGKIQWGPGGSTAPDTDLYRANAGTLTTDGSLTIGGNLDIYTAGRGLQIGEGSNAKMGTAVMSAGTVTVANTSVTATSRIFLTIQSTGGTVGSVYVSARTAGTSFTIKSTSTTDTSTVAYFIVEPG